MGMWSSPFSSKEKALKLKELMSNPWKMTLVDGYKELPESYDLIGSDELFDTLEENEIDKDVRYIVKRYLEKWLENIDSFSQIDKEAVKIVKKIIAEEY